MNAIRLGFQSFRCVSLSNHVKAIVPTQQFRFSSHVIGTKPHLEELISKNKVVVFMKGTPEEPRCGFSNAVTQILRMHGVEYDAHNVLEDDRIREGIKEYSEWPTIPQVYLNKEFVGGCDILIQMHQNGDLIEELQKIGIQSALLQQEEDRKDK